jgi:hypothetical protein
MIRTPYAHQTAGVTAAAARVRGQLGLGNGWQMVAAAFPCANSDFAMATTSNKRQPRRLGQRTT